MLASIPARTLNPIRSRRGIPRFSLFGKCSKRTKAGRELPPYYLVYFLLVELLGFENLGQFEKIAWSVPVDFNGRAFLIEHRKFGVGVFAHDPETEEKAAREIVSRIKKGVSIASPFFEWLAKEAVAASALNVVNNSDDLYARFAYFREAYRQKADEALLRKDERTLEKGKTPDGGEWTTISIPAVALEREARWLGLATIDSFFSWTEHVFIHIAILNGALKTGADVARLAEKEWSEKFKCALDISELISKQFYDQLLEIRRELRNFAAHCAYGKDGKAFNFHSGAGAVPVLLPHRVGARTFTIGEFLTFNDEAALGVIDKFIEHLWDGPRAPAKLYIQDTHLPVILTRVSDGSYARAMSSVEAMQEFVEYLSREADRAADMDW
jgi:hypothetical protein